MPLLPLKRKSFLNFPEAIPNLIPLRRYLTNLEDTYMQFQEALVFAMQDSNVDEQELTARTGSNPRWITEITTNPDWRPKLDTILRLCHALRFNVLTFLDYAESGSRGEHPTPNTQHPTPNTQHPTPNTQHPTPNTQHPTPNTQEGRRKKMGRESAFLLRNR
jgi:hypothetical protein